MITPIPDGTENWGFLLNQQLNDLQGQIADLVSAQANGVQPSSQGYTSWTYDPACNTATSTLPNGTMQMIKLTVPIETQISRIDFSINVAGSVLTVDQNFMGIYDANGTLLTSSADQSAAWQSTGKKQVDVTAVTVSAGFCYVAWLANGTTPPTITRGSAVTSEANSPLNINLTASNARSATFGAGLTELPASIDMSTRTLSNSASWAAIA